MRETSFVNRLKFNFAGSISKRAIVIADADNDEHNELICANLQGELAIFKGKSPEKYAHATDLGMVTACLVGDLFNVGRNHIASINTEGWFFVYSLNPPAIHKSSRDRDQSTRADNSDISKGSGRLNRKASNHDPGNDCTRTIDRKCTQLELQYDQRMPANCKELLLADLDGDDQNELIVGLTDRVLRTYKWVETGPSKGKFVGIYKWEFADQIGAVSLNPSSRHDNCQDIIVAQPGGTYAKLECFDKKPNPVTISGSSNDHKQAGSDSQSSTLPTISSSGSDDNVRTEYISKLTPEYHQLALGQMRNPHISTEVLGGIRDGKNSDRSSLIVIATLDGTLMLVNKDEVLWSLQVDHPLFAAAILETKSSISKSSKLPQSDSTCTLVAPGTGESSSELSPDATKGSRLIKSGRRSQSSSIGETAQKFPQFFSVCSWNGKTYIIDDERNYLRFKFEEAVAAFTAGNYYFDGDDHASLVYATFNNRLVLYYDVVSDPIRPMHLLDELLNNPNNRDILQKLKDLTLKINGVREGEDSDIDSSEIGSQNQIRGLLEDILYSISDLDLDMS